MKEVGGIIIMQQVQKIKIYLIFLLFFSVYLCSCAASDVNKTRVSSKFTVSDEEILSTNIVDMTPTRAAAETEVDSIDLDNATRATVSANFDYETNLEKELVSEDYWQAAYFGLGSHFVTPRLYEMQPSQQEIEHLEEFLDTHAKELGEIGSSGYQHLPIILSDVTGDGISEILIWQLSNKDQLPSEYMLETVSGHGFAFQLETGQFLGELKGSRPNDMGWYEERNGKRVFYSIEADFFRDGNLFSYAYILWKVDTSKGTVECTPEWLYLVQRMYGEVDPYTEESYSLIQPDIEEINEFRDHSIRPLDKLKPQFTEGMAEPIKEFWRGVTAIPTERYDYGELYPSGEIAANSDNS